MQTIDQMIKPRKNRPQTTLVLGAGASRSVSYAHKGGHPSPLDTDFFDLLQRLTPTRTDRASVDAVLAQVRELPHEYWRSMERAFYTLQLRAYLNQKLTAIAPKITDKDVVGAFATCVQSLLRKAHGKHKCDDHAWVLQAMHKDDTVISFNYDLVAERAIRGMAEDRGVAFSPSLYALEDNRAFGDIPKILKLHGSSNWRLKSDGVIEVRMNSWDDLDVTPGYRGDQGTGTVFPIFLPFWDKRIEEKPWLPLWQTAFRRLKETKRMIVWGYSLPQTDLKAQQLFGLALASKAPDLVVIDPSPATRERWRSLLPKARYWEYDNMRDFRSQSPLWWKR